MSTITIDAKDFLAGESNWDYIGNHGFSPDSTGLNLLLKPGVLNFGHTETDRGGVTLTGNIVAGCMDLNPLGGQNIFVDDGGAFYTLSGATFTKRQTATNTGGWQLGTTDIIEYKGNVYATRNGNTNGEIVQLTGTNMTTINNEWWISGIGVAVRHPMEVVEDKLYIGDTNVIYSYDGTTSTTAITLPSDVNITSLRRHPDGRHLIAFCGYVKDFSHTSGTSGKMYIVNKDTLTWEREILTESQVEGSRLVGGIVYVTYGKKLGYFTGSGLKFLKQLKTSGTTYSQSMSNMEDLFLLRDGVNLLIYGDLGNGVKSWHNFYNGSTINVVAYKGTNLILIGTSAATLTELDYSAASLGGTFYSKRYNFGTVVKIRRMDFIHDAKSSGGIMNFSVSYRDTDNTSTFLKQFAWPTGPTTNKSRMEIDLTTDIFQFSVVPQNGILGIKLIRFYFDPIN